MGDWIMSGNFKDMKPKLIGETWRKYPTETSNQKATYGLFECQYCGEEFEVGVAKVKSGHTKSCGCLKGDAHGFSYHKFYKTWKHMVGRCTNPKIKAYKNYGGRGITVCAEWLDIRNFVAWCDLTYPNIEGYTLDRIDNDKGYNPENCRWTDRTTQNINQRIKKNNTSGFVGIIWNPLNKNWRASIRFKNEKINLGSHKTIEEAVQARDKYILENSLPHKLSTDYRGK